MNPVLIAGMPSPALIVTELGRRRLEEVSFFVVCFLLGAALFRLLWNRVQLDFAWWPRLTYFGTLGLLCVWGCLLTVVLSLISGARELMTPAAWKPNGVTYKVAATDPAQDAQQAIRRERQFRIETLKTLLMRYAATHNQRFPSIDSDLAMIPESFWIAVPDCQLKYVYAPHPSMPSGTSPLVTEPQYYDDGHFVLYRNGDLAFIEQIRPVLQENIR
jgi:hypothetical protein